MAEEFKKNQQEVKNEIRKGIVERLLGSKLHTENAEMPIRSSFVNYNMDDYGIIDAHYQALKEEVFKVLKENKLVLSYHLNHYNDGCTVVYIKNRKD